MEKSRSRKKKSSNFIIQGSILAVTSIIVRLIGILYRIPLINIIGDEGMGYYNTAFNIYSIMLLLSSYSLPLAVSKMIAFRLAREQYHNAQRILKASLFYATVVGGIGAAVTWFGADYIASELFVMPLCVYALKTLAPTVWIMAYLGVFRGYFQGLGTMLPTSFSQVFEQVINAVISVTAAASLYQYGLKANLVYGSADYSFAFGAAGSTIGTGVGALIALIFLLILMFTYRRVIKRQLHREAERRVESYGQITKILCLTVVPVILSTAVYNVSTIIDNGMFGKGMETLGKGKEYISQWGIYSGKYRLLINVPMAISNALSSSLIPALSRAVANKNRGQISSRIAMAIRFSMVIAIPAAVGLTVLAGPIHELLFSGNNEMSVRMTILGSAAVVCFSLSTVTNAVLQGINHMKLPLRNSLISLSLHMFTLWVMMMVFGWGIYGVVFSNILFGLTMCILNGLSIRHCLHYRQEVLKTFILPTIASGIMGASAYGTYRLVHMAVSSNTVGTLAAIGIAVIVYSVLLIKFKCIDEVELYGMPAGARMVRIAHKLHLLS